MASMNEERINEPCNLFLKLFGSLTFAIFSIALFCFVALNHSYYFQISEEVESETRKTGTCDPTESPTDNPITSNSSNAIMAGIVFVDGPPEIEKQMESNNKIHIIHMVMGDKSCIDEYPVFNHFRNHSIGNDMIYFNFNDIKNGSEKYNYYNETLNVYNIYFNKSLSWSQGRNYLLKMAFIFEQQQSYKYDYFAFFDDDVVFISDKPGNIDNDKDLHRIIINDSELYNLYEIQFKNETMKYEPAIMTVARSKIRGTKFNPNHCESNSCSISHHDAMCVWIHHELVRNKYIFPYITKMDDICWWESQRYLWNLAYSMYFNHIFMFRGFYIYNPRHSPYPRDVSKGQQMTFKLLKTTLKEIFNNDWIYNKYYQNERGDWIKKNTFRTYEQYTMSGYPEIKGNINYSDYVTFNNTMPTIPV